MADAIFRAVNLRRRFGGLRAVDGVSLDVAGGEFRAIIGPNGAGKSTFFNLITGFVAPDSGTTFFEGRDITGIPPHRLFRSGVSRTFQITSIFPELTIRQNLELALLSHHGRSLDLFGRADGAYADVIVQLLELVALAADSRRRAGTLSHGDQKKLELAVALANKPRLLLLDEPTAGMTAQERLEAMRTVHCIARELGLTVIFTEHDMQVVFSVADRISVLHQGAIVAEGAPDEIRQSETVQQIYLGEEVNHLPPSAGRLS